MLGVLITMLLLWIKPRKLCFTCSEKSTPISAAPSLPTLRQLSHSGRHQYEKTPLETTLWVAYVHSILMSSSSEVLIAGVTEGLYTRLDRVEESQKC